MVYQILYIDKDFDGIIKNYSHNDIIYPIVKVPFTNVGDMISVLDIEIKNIPIVKKFDLLNKKADRVQAPCRYYSLCGGCKGQHFSKNEYIDIKLNNVIRSFRSNDLDIDNKISFINHIDDPFYHRRRAIFSVYKNKLGFNSYRTNKIIEIDNCLLLKKEINDIIPILQEITLHLNISSVVVTCINDKIDVCIHSNQKFKPKDALYLQNLCMHKTVKNVSWQKGKDIQTVIEKEKIYLKYGDHEIKFSAGGFLQASKFGEENLQNLVLSNIDETAKRILDLFCGLGSYTFSLVASNKNIENITAIDSDYQAINSIKNLKANKIIPVIRDIMRNPLSKEELDKFDAIIINPPRVGAKEQIQKLSEVHKDKIILIYCSVSSLIRDLKILLTSSFRYKIDNVYLIDQFIYSPHIEVVVILSLCNTSTIVTSRES